MSALRKSRTPMKPAEIGEDVLEHVAYIIGPMSGAAKALTELRRRKKSEPDVTCYREGEFFLVGPRVS